MDGIKVLLVEDDPGHQFLIAQTLTSGSNSFDLEVVSTGREAVEAVQARSFDCVLMDFNLEDTRADTLLPIIAQVPQPPPVIVISSSRDQDTAVRSMRNGCVDFLPKMEALNGDALCRCVEAAVYKRRKAQDDRRSLKRRIDKLTHLADTDPLTGLSNRRCLDRLFEQRRINSDRRGWASVMMLDLDHFKTINDTHGHNCGDSVLRAVAETLRAAARQEDAVCRYGGEEFVMVKPGTPHAAAVHSAETLREKIARLEIRAEDKRVPVTVSIGVVTCKSSDLSLDTISQSDAALYLAKQRGRNRVSTWPMVLFSNVAQQACRQPRRSVSETLQAVLNQNREHLGRTQWQHLTTDAEDVSKLTVRLGGALGADARDLERLRIAGLCHDLGKFLIPEEVLAKPGTLSPEERALVGRHAEDGAEMFLMLGADPVAAEYIRGHHARTNRAGAANSGHASTPRGARILGVADALSAMTSYRPYRPRLSFAGAMQELERGSGERFDAEIVAAISRGALAEACMV